MPSSQDFIDYFCEQLQGCGFIRWRKMFGEYMVYVNDKPLFLVCDETVYVKRKEEVEHLFREAPTGYPYDGAREHYILDVDDRELCRQVAMILEPITPLPKPKKRKSKDKEEVVENN